MISFAEKIAALEAEGYANAPARAKLAHDVVLKAMEVCGVAKNITVKGGVVMSGLTGDVRRATMDMDVDFVRYGLTDENVDGWVQDRPGRRMSSTCVILRTWLTGMRFANS